MNHTITNFEELSVNSLREDALSIIEAGYNAIDTKNAIRNGVILENNILKIKGKLFDLDDYKRIFVIGFGKASSKAVASIEDVLGNKITDGIVIDKDISNNNCRIVKVYKGTHPLPSLENIESTKKIVELAQQLRDDDLVIVVVSGGGSALLCFPVSEYEQGKELYQAFIRTGGGIEELNTLRKHVSEIKGGGLAKLLYPSTVVSLILCDVPGDHFEDTASGPTYYDKTTIEDAEKILKKYAIPNTFSFKETPKDKMYFENITNIPFISNLASLESMSNKAKELGYEVSSLGGEVYTSSSVMLERMHQLLKPKTVVMAAGELSITMKKIAGTGGRNLFTSGQALDMITDEDVFVAFASDGIDNMSVSAGAIVDVETKNKLKGSTILSSNPDKDLYDELFASSGDRIITGPTGSNISDIYLMLRK